jgi:DNA-binding protein HU-beta
MTKAELIDIVAENTDGLTKAQVAKVYDTIFETITKALAVDGKYSVSGFGNFDVKQRAERKGRNPATGAEITIAASKAVGFKPAAALKETLNK